MEVAMNLASPRYATRVVELKFFGGLSAREIAEVMQMSDPTVEREWAFARTWLYRRSRDSKEARWNPRAPSVACGLPTSATRSPDRDAVRFEGRRARARRPAD